jgi:hypothetical protein
MGVSTRLTNWLLRSLAVVCLVFGAVLFWLPIPLGAPLLAFGFGILITSSATVRKWIRSQRRSRPDLDQWLARLEDRVPRPLALTLRRTRARRSSREAEMTES